MKEVTDKSESPTDCCGEEGQRNSLLPLVSCCGFDESELALLDAVRHFCCGFCVEADRLARRKGGLRGAARRSRLIRMVKANGVSHGVNGGLG